MAREGLKSSTQYQVRRRSRHPRHFLLYTVLIIGFDACAGLYPQVSRVGLGIAAGLSVPLFFAGNQLKEASIVLGAVWLAVAAIWPWHYSSPLLLMWIAATVHFLYRRWQRGIVGK